MYTWGKGVHGQLGHGVPLLQPTCGVRWELGWRRSSLSGYSGTVELTAKLESVSTRRFRITKIDWFLCYMDCLSTTTVEMPPLADPGISDVLRVWCRVKCSVHSTGVVVDSLELDWNERWMRTVLLMSCSYCQATANTGQCRLLCTTSPVWVVL